MKRWNMVFAALLLFCASNAQTQRELYNTSIKAYEAKDYKAFLKLTTTLDSLRPFHPAYTYNLASANALNGNPATALRVLRKLILMNSATAFEADPDFESIKHEDGFKAVISLKSDQNKLIVTSKPVVELSEKELHPEGLVHLSKSKIWLASSIRKRKIVAFDSKTGNCRDWLKDDKMLSVLSMKTDSKEEFLWVATAAFEEMENFDKTLTGKSEILKIDISTKKIVHRYSVNGSHVFGDLFVTKNDIVYVSDSDKPMIYKIENETMEEFISFADGYNLQGLTFNKEQTKLFIADYLKGIAVIDMNSKNKTWLSFPEQATAKGIDGLVFYRNTLIAIQNGVKPIRITKVTLNASQDKISSFKVLDNNRPEFNEPTLATLIDNELYFFANSPWSAYGKNGILDLTKLSNPILFSCKLD